MSDALVITFTAHLDCLMINKRPCIDCSSDSVSKLYAPRGGFSNASPIHRCRSPAYIYLRPVRTRRLWYRHHDHRLTNQTGLHILGDGCESRTARPTVTTASPEYHDPRQVPFGSSVGDKRPQSARLHSLHPVPGPSGCANAGAPRPQIEGSLWRPLVYLWQDLITVRANRPRARSRLMWTVAFLGGRASW